MNFTIQRRVGVLVATAVLAVPGVASANGLDTAVGAVQKHTDKADAALDRAVSAFERNRDRRGTAQFDRSRKQMGLAIAAAAKLLRNAESAEERAAAARALALVARQRDENVEELVGVLSRTDGRAERRVATAARADTRGREKAIGVLSELAAQLPPQAANGIATAIAALGTDRPGEVRLEARALSSKKVGAKSKRRVADAVEASVEGQRDAAERVAALIASENMPAESKQGLQTAYDAITAEHGSVARILSRFSDRMPARIREFVSQIVTQAHENAQDMRDNRPAPPAGPPAGTPGGGPEGTPGGPPTGTPGP
jgi:hypothetical protein